MPAIAACSIDPIWDQFAALVPPHQDTHPLGCGCHRSRIRDRVVFDKLVQVLVFGCASHRSADATCSATTLRRRRDAWIAAGLMETLRLLVLEAYDQMIGLALADVAVDGCLTKAPGGGELAGRSPVDRGKQGRKRSTVVDANGSPLGGVAAPANRHDSPLLEPTLDRLGPLPDAIPVPLDRGYDSGVTRARLDHCGMRAEIARRGAPAPIAASSRWPVERTNAHKKLVWCTERRGAVVDFWIAFSAVIIIVGRLVRQAWTHYRWDGRPSRKP